MSALTVKNAIVSKLQGISKIQQVYTYPETNLEGYPAAIVVPSDNESDYQTVSENQRDYGFIIALYVTLKDGTGTPQNAYDTMYDLYDDVINTFDTDPYLTGTISLPASYTIVGVEPVPGQWGQDNELQAVVSTITLRVRVQYDTN